ncbi:Heparan sulfate glucosamine 3-O-sulfotransferase 1 [Mactra antiquata]
MSSVSNEENNLSDWFTNSTVSYTRLRNISDWSHSLLKYQIPKSVRRKLLIILFILIVCFTLMIYSCVNCYVNCTSVCTFTKPSYILADGKNVSHNVNASYDQHMSRRLPQCIIIGVRKAGTRALLEYLNIHPDIVVTSKEQHFFNTDDRYSLGLEYYRNQMPLSFSHQITIEKTPAYFTDLMSQERIYRMNSSIRLLLIIRDPVVRLVSDYTQLMYGKKVKNKHVIALEDLIIDRNGDIDLDYKPIQRSIYYHYFINWLEFFRRDQIHIVDGDKLISNPYPEINEVESFLGLGHRISKDLFYYNASKGFFCVNLDKLDNPCLGESKGRPHPEVDPDILTELYDFYRPRNKMFFELANKSFDWP